MQDIFLKLLNMSITAGWLVLAVLLLRPLLKKAPKAVRCGLWALVGIRLICPFSIESVLSLIPSAQPVNPDILLSPTPSIQSGITAVDTVVNPIIQQTMTPQAGDSINPLQVVTAAATAIWLLGVVAMVVYGAVSYLRMRRKVAASVHVTDNVYLCDEIPSPFILGMLRPRIYLPSGMSDEAQTCVIAHERAHLKRMDHLWKPLGFALLAVYWFNPLMWVAYILLCRDIELACDERVIREMDAADKKRYAETLLACSMPRHLTAACPLAFGEVGVKTRIQSVLHYKKPAFWLILVALIVCIAMAIGFLTNPTSKLNGRDTLRQFDPVNLVFEASQYDFVQTAREAPSYRLTKTMVLSECPDGKAEWNTLGTMKLVGLDEMFEWFDKGLWHVVWPKEIIDNNKTAYKLETTVGKLNLLYLFMEQKNGDCYIGYGYSDSEFGAHIRWLYLVEQTNAPDAKHTFTATVLKVAENELLVQPDPTEDEAKSASEIYVSTDLPEGIGMPTVQVGDVVEITYNGEILETYPAQIRTVYAITPLPYDIVFPSTAPTAFWVGDPWYLYLDIEPSQLPPTISLDNSGRFAFNYYSKSKHTPMGTYTLIENTLTLTEDGEYRSVFVFNVEGNVMTFDADRSNVDPALTQGVDGVTPFSIPDGHRFVRYPARGEYNATVSWANWTGENEIYKLAHNSEQVLKKGDNNHLPIYKLDTLEDLVKFKETFQDVLSFDGTYDEISSFNKATAHCDDQFMLQNTLLVVYVPAGRGSYRFGVNCVTTNNETYCVHVEQTNDPGIFTADMAGWWVTVALTDEEASSYTHFDADLNAVLS